MTWELHHGHVLTHLAKMPSQSVHTVVTSPPYWGLRTYQTERQIWGGDADCTHEWQNGNAIRPMTGGVKSQVQQSNRGSFSMMMNQVDAATCVKCHAWLGELGCEPTIQQFIEHLMLVFREVRRVLRNDGIFWLNIGDTYAGSGRGPDGHNSVVGHTKRQGFTGVRWNRQDGVIKRKDLCLIPERLLLALQADGWYVRSKIRLIKIAPMPESVKDRPINAHEDLFMLTKSAQYFYDAEAIRLRQASAGVQHAALRGNAFNWWIWSPEKADFVFCTACRIVSAGKPVCARCQRSDTLCDHYAMFPTFLPTLCIDAATSAKGACAQCGAPWVRHATLAESLTADPWRPSCTCTERAVRPCVVLDPFSGSGTTVLIADRLGRHGIGIELNPDYYELSRQRLISDAPLVHFVNQHTNQLELI